MSEAVPPLVDYASRLVLILLGSGLILSFLRLVKGPSLPDRVAALDAIAMLALCYIAVASILSGWAVYLDVAMVLALVVFLGTVGFARYVEKRAHR
jgi:multicomponent Na+:H+ antiporter subunit F